MNARYFRTKRLEYEGSINFEQFLRTKFVKANGKETALRENLTLAKIAIVSICTLLKSR